MAKNLSWEAKGLRRDFRSQPIAREALNHYCLNYYLMQIYCRENGGIRQRFNSAFQRVLSFTSRITELQLFASLPLMC